MSEGTRCVCERERESWREQVLDFDCKKIYCSNCDANCAMDFENCRIDNISDDKKFKIAEGLLFLMPNVVCGSAELRGECRLCRLIYLAYTQVYVKC